MTYDGSTWEQVPELGNEIPELPPRRPSLLRRALAGMLLGSMLRRVLGEGGTPSGTMMDAAVAGERLAALRATFDSSVEVLASRLASGDISVTVWEVLMRHEISTLHISAQVLGAGGWGAVDQAGLDRAREFVTTQYGYLDRWAQALRTLPEGAISEAQVAVRARMYGGASSELFSRAYGASLGLPPMPFYPAQGTICLTNCGCEWQYVQLPGRGNWDCFWRRSKDDSCDTCIAREAAAAPLRVRDGFALPLMGSGLMAR